MTIIAPERNTRRDMHLAAYAAMTDLARVEALTPAVIWRIETLTGCPLVVTGQMPGNDTRAVFDAIAAYAEFFDDARWDVERYPADEGGRGALHLYGTYGGVQFDIWGGLQPGELDHAACLVAVAA